MTTALSNVNITALTPLVKPRELKRALPLDPQVAAHIIASRDLINAIIHGRDERLLLIIGPCSIHDSVAAAEYASRLLPLAQAVRDKIIVVMRVYFEKPRTAIGWRGMIFDPHLNGSYEIETGLRTARTLLRTLAGRGIITATEMLDPVVPQYIDDLICWAAIGARTTESQTHRELASGLSMAVGFKNSTDGTIDTAINAIVAARSARKFIGIDVAGQTCVVTTTGNANTHLILRGGKRGPNYNAQSVEQAVALMQQRHLPPAILIDCNHGNSQKDHRKQRAVFDAVLQHRHRGQRAVIGAMVESNISAGRQDIQRYSGKIQYGISITDPCIGWDETERLITDAYRLLPASVAG